MNNDQNGNNWIYSGFLGWYDRNRGAGMESNVRFSQTTVSSTMGNGMHVLDASRQIRNEGFERSGLNPIDVVNWGDGTHTALDNRRLLAYRMSGSDEGFLANVYDPNHFYRTQNISIDQDGDLQVDWSQSGVPLQQTAGEFAMERVAKQRNVDATSLAQRGFTQAPTFEGVDWNANGLPMLRP